MFIPMLDRIIATPVEKKVSEGGIILPENDSNHYAYARVDLVGEGTYTLQGTLIPTKSEPGDIIVFFKDGVRWIEIDKVQYITMRESEIIGIFKEEKDA